MSVVDSSFSTKAGNEPGQGTFNPRNFPEVMRLAEDLNYGRDPDLTTVSGDKKQALATYEEQLKQYGLWDFVENSRDFEEQLFQGVITPELNNFMAIILDEANIGLRNNLMKFFPRTALIMDAWAAVAQFQVDSLGGKEAAEDLLEREYMLAFGDGFDPAIGVDNTADLVNKWFKERENVPPGSINPWEMRIGGSKFFVPPVSVNVSRQFKVGSLAGGALRQQNTPKFNSGHSETMIEVTLYFPNHESIWGFDYEGAMSIDFDTAPEGVIDEFTSSLRGLITQFKYAPFLPIRNDYINRVYDVTAVSLHSMTIQTVEGFPFCLAVNLQMMKFNFKAYLPPVSDFNQAVHWGRFRQYIGRAAQKMNSVLSQGFLIEEVDKTHKQDGSNQPKTTVDPLDEEPSQNDTIIRYEGEPSLIFDKLGDFREGKNFDIYYPMRTPAKVFAPDTSDFRQPGEDAEATKDKNAWEVFMSYLGFDIDTQPEILYDTVKTYDSRGVYPKKARDTLLEWLNITLNVADTMSESKLDQFVEDELAKSNLRGLARDEYEKELRNEWFRFVFSSWKSTPFFQKYAENAQLVDGQFVIKEWQVPMEKMIVNWDNVIVDGVSVTLANNIVRLQLQMQEEPVHQHIGGRDSMVSVSMTVFGEDDLARFRRVFEHINGLARLEHAHGVLGFLGIKNVITALAGIKYVLPLTFEVNSIPDFPHVYKVNMSFVDFDVFQQKREQLSSTQQRQLIESFGKRNPFFRIKQLWGAFNAYPDFPLAVRDKDTNIVGHLDPDFYFRAFQMFDDDIAYWGLDQDKKGDDAWEKEGASWWGERTNKTQDEASSTSAAAMERRIKAIDDLLKNQNLTVAQRNAYVGERNILSQKTAVTDSEAAEQAAQSYGGIVYSNNSVLGSKTGAGYKHEVFWGFGLWSEDQSQSTNIKIDRGKIALGQTTASGGSPQIHPNAYHTLYDTVPEAGLTRPSIPGLTAYAGYQASHADGSRDPAKHYELMVTDTAYRDISGRMIRAYPTYMLWLIDEGGRFAGVKLFDNFYGLQSVIDLSVHKSEDVLGDTLVLRLSNLYKKLTTPYAGYIFRDQGSDMQSDNAIKYGFIDLLIDRQRNAQTGTYTGSDPDLGTVALENIRLKPGVRVHLRMGYSSNPNSLPTVFNGTITEVRAGDIVEVVAQSDAIELSPYINSTNKEGHSGKLDGAMNTGLWLSEPRDLMVRLLSMGSSTFKESFANATKGMVFSENKFGIRHFGQMLYEPLTEDERQRHQNRYNRIKSEVDATVSAGKTDANTELDSGQTLGDAQEFLNSRGEFFDSALGGASTRIPIISTMQDMWSNFFRKRDFEIYKRNIYPGNGLGVAQFLGGDSLDGGQTMAAAYGNTAEVEGQRKTPVPGGMNGYFNSALGNATLAQEVQDAQDIRDQDEAGQTPEPENPTGDSGAFDAARGVVDDISTAGGIIPDALSPLKTLKAVDFGLSAVNAIGDVFSGKGDNPILRALGLDQKGPQDDDLKGFDEISFRAQTYMKSVWDLFQLCAALLPNYIVAVREFEDRSTVFYGKPHWMYTSGLIPITLGVPPSDPSSKPEEPDAELNKLLNEALKNANSFADIESQMTYFQTAGAVSPYDTGAGIAWSGSPEDVTSLPDIHPENGAKLPVKRTKVGIEMHLPTSGNLQTDIKQHRQLAELPANLRHPKYMDREGGPAGGVGNVSKENQNLPGANGAFGYLDPAEEQWYMNMRWPYNKSARGYIQGHTQSMYKYKRVLVYAEKTGRACVCSIGEYGPSQKIADGGRAAGISPDVAHTLGISTDDVVLLGFVPDETRLGPTSGTGIGDNFAGSDGVPSGVDPVTAAAGEALKPDLDEAFTIEEIRASDASDSEKENFIDQFTAEGFDVDTGDPIEKAKALGTPSHIIENAKNNKILYAYEFGGFDHDVPVWLAPSQKDPLVSGSVDIVGIVARRLYDKNFNKHFEGSKVNLGDIFSVDVQNSASGVFGPENVFLDHSGAGPSGGRSVKDADDIWHEFRGGNGGYFGSFDETEETLDMWFNGELSNIDGSINPGPGDQNNNDEFRKKTVARFMRFMWQEPYARAWLVMTTSRHFDSNNLDGNGPIPDIDAPGILPGDQGDDWDFGVSPVKDIFKAFLVIHNKDTWDQRDPSGKKYVAGERQQLLDIMRQNNKQGIDSASVLGRSIENLKDMFDKTVGRIWKAISAGMSAILGLYRISMGQLGNALENVHAMQRQANILNKVFNDSIYYAAGQPGSLLRMADNPFTREYAEPVIEIREPFQRVHYISSFQHIVSNNIVENLNNVATVVTATSDGNYPVTVYFDRGAPPERQTEKVVETGLFWDNATGSGFFGFLHPLLHPIETARSLTKTATGSSDELMSKRVGLWHLKESLKDIYTGEVVILGNPDIRPHDLLYLADVYERMYGLCEVEQVVHHFTPETGFITSITPNALVTINDPARWSMTSWVSSWFSVKNMRDDVRLMLQQRGRGDSSELSRGVTVQDLAASLETQMLGHLQYAHGNSAIVRDLAAAAATGGVGAPSGAPSTGDWARPNEHTVGTGTYVSGFIKNSIPGLNMISDAIGAPFKWIRENLMDQHGCYIQYLNKDGQPMDAGLSYNQGVAVGAHHSTSLLPGILGLELEVFRDGHRRITTNDLLGALGWNEIEVTSVQKEISYWIAQTNAQLLDAAGKSPDPLPGQKPQVEIVEVSNSYFDGDTFHSTNGKKWRLAGVAAGEISHNYSNRSLLDAQGNPLLDDQGNPIQTLPVDETYARNHIAYQAAAFMYKRLYADPIAQGYRPTVAIRISGANTNTYDRIVATVFHNVPVGTPPEDRNRILKEQAEAWPINEWDSYMNDGRPYTINWEVIAAGLAQTALFGNQFDTDRGVLGIGKGR